jgi:hypothetical protein
MSENETVNANPTPEAELSSREKFERWVETPLEVLRNIPNGDGAFVALCISFSLYERFIHSVIKSPNSQTSPDFFDLGAKDLGCDPKTFKRFWESYRVGMQHFFQPKNYTEKKGQGDRWGWDIASSAGYNAFPEIVSPSAGHFIIKIDPWKFSDHVVVRWRENPRLLDAISVSAFGNVIANPIESTRPPESDPQNLSGYKTVYEGPPPPSWESASGK